jgi:hypothetical protein
VQVTSTKYAEIELEKRLMNIIQREVKIRQGVKHRGETDMDELWLDRNSLSWDTATSEQDSAITDR